MRDEHQVVVQPRQGNQRCQRVEGRDPVDAVHKVKGVDPPDSEDIRQYHSIPRQAPHPRLPEEEGYGRKMDHDADPPRERHQVVEETNGSHQKHGSDVPGMTEAVQQKPK